jgi:hypothetical protein
MMLVTSAILVSISWNGLSPIRLNKQIGNHLNKHIINASSVVFPLAVINAVTLCELLF